MEDSPLSILASITGILTFFAAIVGFVFVRSKLLQNGIIEMDAILVTAAAVISDSETWLTLVAMKDVDQDNRLDRHFKLRDTLRKELFKTELQIITEYYSADLLGSSIETQWVATMTRTDMNDFWQEIDAESWLRFHLIVQQRPYRSFIMSTYDSTQRDKLGRAASTNGPLGVAWRSIVNLGASPPLLRWYIIREKVLEKVKSRETIQSRLLLYQVSTANSAAHTLLRQNDVLKLELVQLKHLLHQALSPTGPVGETQNQVPVSASSAGRTEYYGRWAPLLNKETQTDFDLTGYHQAKENEQHIEKPSNE